MPLEIRRPEQQLPAGAVADRRLFLTADKGMVVEDGDQRAAFLFATPGVLIEPAEMGRLGLSSVDGRLVLPGTLPAAPPPPPPAASAEVLEEGASEPVPAAAQAGEPADLQAPAAAAPPATPEEPTRRGRRSRGS